jgi:hypothetical protein
VIQPSFNGRGELYPYVVGSDNCQYNFLIAIIKYTTSVFPDVVRGNVIKGAFRAFEEECLFKSIVMRLCMVSCAGPPLFKDYFSDVSGNGTVKCHMVDVFFPIAVGALFLPSCPSFEFLGVRGCKIAI